MPAEILTTLASQQAADLQRVANNIGADIVPYLKRIEEGVEKILRPYYDLSITAIRQEKIIKEIRELTNKEYSDYNKHYKAQMKLVSNEEIAAGVIAIDSAIESDVEISEPSKTDVNTAILATPIQQGDKSWNTYNGMQESFKAQYVDEIVNAVVAASSSSANGKELESQVYSLIHYYGRKASKTVLDRSRRSANAMAATGVNHVSNVTRVQFGEANKKLVKGYRFIAVLDSSTSQTCRSSDQEVMAYDNPKFKNWSPPRHRGCRSALAYEVDERYKLDPDKTKRASSFRVDGLQDPKPVSSKTIYYNDMSKLKASDQDAILGPTLGKAFRKGLADGTMTPESFAKATVDSLYQPLTIKQMSERNNRLGELLRGLK